MSGKTKIEWADRVWNPTVGCTPVSEGCRHCYAKRMFERFFQDHKFENVKCHPERLEIPERWIKPQRIFVDSMSDLFHPDVPDDFIAKVWMRMFLLPRHTFMVLTKRPERMKQWVDLMLEGCMGRVFSNIWLGVSVEDQKTANERIPLLLQTPAAKRFVSVEPILGDVDLEKYLSLTDEEECEILDANQSYEITTDEIKRSFPKLDWVICGGESGPNARPLHPDWARSLRDQCQAAGVPFFFKQWGEWTTQPGSVDLSNRKQTYSGNNVFSRVGKKNAGNLLDGKVWAQFPEVEERDCHGAKNAPRNDMAEVEK